MAIKPEDLRTKVFTSTQFKRGYAENEVDDCLDEVCTELKRLNTHIALLEADNRTLHTQAEKAMSQTAVYAKRSRNDVPVSDPVKAPVPDFTKASQHVSPVSDAVPDATGILVLAQQMHDKHIADGEAKRDKLIGQGEKKRDQQNREMASSLKEHNKSVSELRERGVGIIEEARREKSNVLTSLGAERIKLECEIVALQDGKKDAHDSLKMYLNEQIKLLEQTV